MALSAFLNRALPGGQEKSVCGRPRMAPAAHIGRIETGCVSELTDSAGLRLGQAKPFFRQGLANLARSGGVLLHNPVPQRFRALHDGIEIDGK